jgi:hypothetical protein
MPAPLASLRCAPIFLLECRLVHLVAVLHRGAAAQQLRAAAP